MQNVMEDNEVKYISLSAAAEMTDYSQEYISLLCRTKRMRGVKFGRNWVTTAEWVGEYIDRTKGKVEMRVPARIEKKTSGRNKTRKSKNKSIAEEKTGLTLQKPQLMAFNEVTAFAFFFGIMLFAFAFFQEMMIIQIGK